MSASFSCPECGGVLSCITNSRRHEMGIKRRRKCHQCGGKWSTIEMTFDGDMPRAYRRAIDKMKTARTAMSKQVKYIDHMLKVMGESDDGL